MVDPDLRRAVIEWFISELKKKNYDEIHRDYIIEGDGVRHKLDIYAVQHIHSNLKVAIGIVVMDKDVKVEDIEKYIAWKEELPVDKIAIVALRSVDEQVYKLAPKYGIDIIVPSEELLRSISLPEHLTGYVRHIEPKIEWNSILSEVREKLRPGLFRKSKWIIEGYTLAYIPVIEARIVVEKRSAVTEELELIEGTLVFDAVEGYLLRVRNGCISVDKDFGSIKEFTDEALEVLRRLSELGSSEVSILASELKLTADRVRGVLEMLSAKGLIDLYGDYVEFRGIDTSKFSSIISVAQKHSAPVHDGEPSDRGKGFARIDPMIDTSKFSEVLESMKCEVKGLEIVYYPIYVVFAKEVKNSSTHEKVIIYDGITGHECENVSALLVELRVIDSIRDCMKRLESAG